MHKSGRVTVSLNTPKIDLDTEVTMTLPLLHVKGLVALLGTTSTDDHIALVSSRGGYGGEVAYLEYQRGKVDWAFEVYDACGSVLEDGEQGF